MKTHLRPAESRSSWMHEELRAFELKALYPQSRLAGYLGISDWHSTFAGKDCTLEGPVGIRWTAVIRMAKDGARYPGRAISERVVSTEQVSSGRVFPRSPLRVLNMLEFIAAQSEGSSLAQISSALEEPKTSLLALLRALVASGVLTAGAGTYRLGSRGYALGAMIVARRDFPAMAKPDLRDLSDRSGETVLLSILTRDRDQTVYVDRADSSNPIRYMAAIGETRPLYASAGGLMLLANLPQAEQDSYLRTVRLVQHTPNTISTKADLRERLAGIRRTGVATTDGDISPDVAGFAAPVLDETGATIASVVIGAPAERARPHRDELIELVVKTGEQISRALGYFAKS